MNELNEDEILKPMKCKQCRSVVIDNFDGIIINGHGENLKPQEIHEKSACRASDPVWYLDVDKCPDWIMDRVNEQEWVKGRLNCPKCDARIGLFDFKKGTKCTCAQYVLPSVSIIKSKVDINLL